MREISLDDNPSELPVDTVLIYGDTGSGKTTWSAQWPRPLFLSVQDEGGHESLRGYPDDWLFEPGVKPRVWALSEMGDMAVAYENLKPLVASKQVMTIVVSSITFYADLYLAKLLQASPGADTRQIYGALGTHLRDLRVKIHSLGVNVIWEALVDHPEPTSDGKPARAGRPLIPGKQADKFSAGVGYVFHARHDERREGGKVVEKIYKQYTQPYAGYLARPRIAPGLPPLPNPMTDGYQEFLQARGYDPDLLRKKLPALAARTAIVAPKPVAPPITQAATTTAAPKVTTRTTTTTTAPKVVTPTGAKTTTNVNK